MKRSIYTRRSIPSQDGHEKNQVSILRNDDNQILARTKAKFECRKEYIETFFRDQRRPVKSSREDNIHEWNPDINKNEVMHAIKWKSC